MDRIKRKLDAISHPLPKAKRTKPNPSLLLRLPNEIIGMISDRLGFHDWARFNVTSKAICKATNRRERVLTNPKLLPNCRARGLRSTIDSALPYTQTQGWRNLTSLELTTRATRRGQQSIFNHLPGQLRHLLVAHVTNETLEKICSLSYLQTLQIGHTEVTSLEPLHRLNRLQSLVIKKALKRRLLSTANVTLLQHLPSLVTFGWQESYTVSKALIEQVAKMVNLRVLDLQGSPVPKDDFPLLANLTQLHTLRLRQGSITLSNFSHLQKLPLQTLSISSSSLPAPIASRLPISLKEVALSMQGKYYCNIPTGPKSLTALLIDELNNPESLLALPFLRELHIQSGFTLETLPVLAKLNFKIFSVANVDRRLLKFLKISLCPICPSLAKPTAKEWEERLKKGITQDEIKTLFSYLNQQRLGELGIYRTRYFDALQLTFSNLTSPLYGTAITLARRPEVISLFPQQQSMGTMLQQITWSVRLALSDNPPNHPLIRRIIEIKSLIIKDL